MSLPVLLCVLFLGCAVQPPVVDPLPSWNETGAKTRILQFIERVSNEAGPDFVPVADRIAVFDNDGTLIVERPTIVQFEFLYNRIKEMAPDNPAWIDEQPFKAVLEDDRAALRSMGFRGRRPLVDAAQSEVFQEDYDAAVKRFLENGRHADFGRQYLDLVYAPMLELIALLEANEFRVFIVSGGGIDFIRGFSESIYGVPRDRVIGSSVKTDLRQRGEELSIYRKPGFASMNVSRFKPMNIWLHIGRRPIFAVGNSDGDLEMLKFTLQGGFPSMAILVQHDDAEREFEYSDDSVEVRKYAAQNDWVSVSMREDFGRVFVSDPVPAN